MKGEPVTADLALMRELNQALILNLVRQQGLISRAEIAERTRLSRSTVSAIVNELIAAERIYELKKGASRGGRRPILLGLNYRAQCAIGIELATTYLDLVITDLRAEIVFARRQPFDIGVGPEAALATVQQAVEHALAASGIEPRRVAGVGIGVPGPLAGTAARMIAPPIMPGWNGVVLKERFSAALPYPVIVDNDANLGALAEYRLGIGQGIRNMAYIYLSYTGIGAGLILNGAIYRGDIGSAGEIGHLTIAEDGPRCSCGSYGCLEAMAGVPRLLQQVAALNGAASLTLDELIARAQQGDAVVVQVLAGAGHYLGIAVASLLNLCNPGLVVLGGPLAAAGDALLTAVRTTAERRALPITLQQCRIVAGALGAHAVALGAAGQIVQSVFSPAALETLVEQL